MIIDSILEKYNLKYEDLKPAEKETLNGWMEAIESNQISVEKIKMYISAMKESVEQELTKVGHESKQDILLKARLRNYMLLEAFLISPDKARKAMELALQGMKS